MTEKPLIYFMHIPKTAGMTMQTLARRHYKKPGELELIYTQQANLDGFDDRQELEMVMGHFRFGYHRFSSREPRYFAFLREPISHVISHYQYTFDRPEKFEFLPDVNNLLEFARCPYGYNLQTRFISGIENIEGREKEVLQKAKENLLRHVEVLGLTERFDESLLMMRQPLNWNLVYYQKRNEGKARKKFKPSEAELDELRSIIRYDIELYEFGKQLFENQVDKHPALKEKVRQFQTVNYWFWKLNPTYTRLKVALGLAKS